MKLQIIFATGNDNKVREIREIVNDPEITVMSMKQLGIHSDPEETGTTFQENALIKARACAAELKKHPEIFDSSTGTLDPSGQPRPASAMAVSASEDPSPEPAADPSQNPSKLDPAVPIVVLSDDSGLVVDALSGAPGIYSARYMGRDTSYTLKMQHIMDELDHLGAEGKARSARFVCACAAVFPFDVNQPASFQRAPAMFNNKVHLSSVDSTVNKTPDAEGSDREKATARTFPHELVVTGIMEGEIGHEIRGAHGFGYDPFFWLPEYGKTSAELTDDEKNAISHRGKAFRAMILELKKRFHDPDSRP